MKFNISGFTDVGTVRDSNQDRILLNGNVLREGVLDFAEETSCVCFVADGVGGNRSGDFASDFVLQRIQSIDHFSEIDQSLRGINTDLIAVSAPRRDLTGTATTLTGMIATDDTFRIVHVGDSQMWLLRNRTFFKVTNDQVSNEYEANSPLLSYFGGGKADLKFDENIFVKEIAINDLFLICSDGLFKSLNHNGVRAILESQNDLPSHARALLKECLQRGADDNVSGILIQRTQ